MNTEADMTKGSNTRLAAIVIALLALTGCATCQRHPYICAVGGAVIVGSIAASYASDHDRHAQHFTPLCAPHCIVQ